MDLESINIVFGETSKKLCLVPWLALLKFLVSHTPPRKSAYTVRYGTVRYYIVRYGTGTVRYGMVRYGTVL